ncbi:hypoxanthine phosphoribosyltransferase [Ruminococcus sp.]|uniref:hypoxanthine phosphoribosyltransferase n=1 Tax=Ruminococcus sp. TaxID=41978 RepID=UPI00344A0E57
MPELEANIVQVLLTKVQIQTRVQELGAQLASDYADKMPLFVCLLKGSSIFFADLVRAVTIPLELDFMRASSYGDSMVTSGHVQFEVPLSQTLTGRHVVLVEDILDTGTTLHAVLPVLEAQKPASLAVCTLLDKPERRKFEVSLAYRGFSIPDAFVVGYGLDYAGLYRNLPYIGIYENSEEQQMH